MEHKFTEAWIAANLKILFVKNVLLVLNDHPGVMTNILVSKFSEFIGNI